MDDWRWPPHPATVVQPKAPFGAPAAPPPHPATMVQPKMPFGASTGLPPHPAMPAKWPPGASLQRAAKAVQLRTVHVYAPILDPQQIEDQGMKALLKNVSEVSALWEKGSGMRFAEPKMDLLMGTFDLEKAAAGDIIVIYGHGSSTLSNALFNYEDAALSRKTSMAARDLPAKLAADGLKKAQAYCFVLDVCYSGKVKQLDHLTGPPFTNSFAEEFRLACRAGGYFTGSRVWGPVGVAYREISSFGWLTYENAAKKKKEFGIAGLTLNTAEILEPNAEQGYQILTV